MKVIIRLRVTPFWRLSRQKRRKPRLERIRPFTAVAAQRRGAPPLAIWAASVLLMIGFLSVSMFATLTVEPAALTMVDEEDPPQPIIGKAVADCRVAIADRGELKCPEFVEYLPDDSQVVTVPEPSSTTDR